MSEESRKETIGKVSRDLSQKESPTNDPIELQREMQSDYEANFFQCVERGKKECIRDFYVVVITKKERLMHNVLRNYFGCRNSCPTPEWDQAVYKYHRSEERVEFLWVIPSRDTCKLFRENVLQIPGAERPLLGFILDFEDGSLLKLAKTLNGESTEGCIIL